LPFYTETICPESRKIGNTAGLEIFLSHAGLAMDKAFLERMLREKKQDEKGR
jgi:hypothetical protein